MEGVNVRIALVIADVAFIFLPHIYLAANDQDQYVEN